MTKEQFFELPVGERKHLIGAAHGYYLSDFNEDLKKVESEEVREFIAMCIRERNAYAAVEATLI